MLRTYTCIVVGFFALTACSGDDSASSDAGTGAIAGDTSTAGSSGMADDGSSGAVDSSGDGGSSSEADSTGAGACAMEFPAIVSDIDETLTTSDAEFLMQLEDGNYDPMERAGGSTLINAYADLGYRVLYLTARAENLNTMVTDETAREATMRWLVEHGYPTGEETTLLVLSETLVFGSGAQEYKAETLLGLQSEGWRFDYAYGNADSDIGAYEEAGIAKDATFIIGEEAGASGTVAIEDEDWLGHNDSHLPTVPAVCE